MRHDRRTGNREISDVGSSAVTVTAHDMAVQGDIKMATGTVKWFNAEKGFGFIAPEDGDDLFIHISNVDPADAQRISDNDPVEFEVRPGRKGDEAYDVRITG